MKERDETMTHPEFFKHGLDPLKPLYLFRTPQRQRRFTRGLLWVAGWWPGPPARHPQQDSCEPQSARSHEESGKGRLVNFFQSSILLANPVFREMFPHLY